MRLIWLLALTLLGFVGAFLSDSAFGRTPAGWIVLSLLGVLFAGILKAAWTGARSLRLPPRVSEVAASSNSKVSTREPVEVPRRSRAVVYLLVVLLAGWGFLAAINILIGAEVPLTIGGSSGEILQGLGWVVVALGPLIHGLWVFGAILNLHGDDPANWIWISAVLGGVLVIVTGANLATLLIAGESLVGWMTP